MRRTGDSWPKIQGAGITAARVAAAAATQAAKNIARIVRPTLPAVAGGALFGSSIDDGGIEKVEDPLYPLWNRAQAAADQGDMAGALFFMKALAQKGVWQAYARIGELYERGTTGVSRDIIDGCRMALNSTSPPNGFVKNSTAPAFMGWTVIGS